MKRFLRKLYYKAEMHLPPLWIARLDNTIKSPEWREQKKAQVKVYFKRKFLGRRK